MTEAVLLNPFQKITPTKGSGVGGFSHSGAPSPGGGTGTQQVLQHQQSGSVAQSIGHSWVEGFAAKFFGCAECGGIVADPVILKDANVLACRGCTAHLDPSEVADAPVSIVQAAVELRHALHGASASSQNSSRKTVKVRRTKIPSPSPGDTTRSYFHVVAGTPDSAPGFAPVHVTTNGVPVSAPPPPPPLAPFSNGPGPVGSGDPFSTFQGLNPNVVKTAAQKYSPHKSAPSQPPSQQQQQQQQQQHSSANHVSPLRAPGTLGAVAGQQAASKPSGRSSDREGGEMSQLVDATEAAVGGGGRSERNDEGEEAPQPTHASHCAATEQAPDAPFIRALEAELQAQERDFQLIENRLRQTELFELMQTGADELSIAERMERMDLVKRFKVEHRGVLSKQKDSSKVLKNLADEKYESSQYTAAIDLYTKALDARAVDGLTKLPTLYGNRSAAFYMAGRYREALEDCKMVLEYEPESYKMYQRAAKCAVSLGDLQLAKKYFSYIPADKMTPAYTTERDKIEDALRMFDRAQQSFGQSEADESWLMLVALYSEQIFFRVRCAEHFFHQRQFRRAEETLSVLMGPQRTSQVAHLLAKCMFMSGFEHFDRARSVLEAFRAASVECREMLDLINVVDDGKQQGNVLFSQKRFGEAATFYTKSIEAAKHNDQILRILYCNRAAAYKELGRYKEGIDDCTKALKVDNQFTKAYARRARCHQMLGDHHAAIRDFKAAVKFDPTDADLADELRRAEGLLADEHKREKDLYYVLGVARTATEDQIRTKYKELALRLHPDKCVNMDSDEKAQAEHKFKLVCSAYQTLVDQTKRREYDLKQEKERLARTSSYTSFFTGGSAAPPGGPTQPPFTRYGSGMPERRSNHFW